MLTPVEDPPVLDVPIEPPCCNRTQYYQELESNKQNIIKGANCCFPSCAISRDLVRKVLAEAVGTFIMVFCIYGILASMNIMGVRTGLMEYAATAALTVIVVVICIGPISGAHVNPAVTLAFAIVGPFPWSKVPLYVAAQVVGSVLATVVGRLVYGVNIEFMMTKPAHGCTTAFCVEFIASLIIIFLIAALSNDPTSTPMLSAFGAGVGIGLGVLITGPVSGGSLNPARSLGPALVLGEFRFLWIYLVAPTLGSIFGGVLFRILRLQGWSSKQANPSSLSSSSSSIASQQISS